jgi:hypothetical protein
MFFRQSRWTVAANIKLGGLISYHHDKEKIKMKRFYTVLVLALLLSACGQSADSVTTQVASTMTAIAGSWTATPANTPTSTPVPYSTTIYVVDENNLPLEGAEITLSNINESKNSQLSDSQGVAQWDNLSDSQIEIICNLQGYKAVVLEKIIERGENKIEITLERDPFGLLPSENLADGEILLFIEDFQDNTDEFVDLAGNWKIIEDPTESGNKVFEVSPKSTDRDSAYITFGDKNLVDFIIQYRVKYIDLDYKSDNWIWFTFRSKYSMSFSPYWNVIDIIDFSKNDWVWLQQTATNFRSDSWYKVRIEAIGSDVSFYINDRMISRVRDIREPSQAEIPSLSTGADVTAYFDDIVLKTPAK